jgi:hypothetical protein
MSLNEINLNIFTTNFNKYKQKLIEHIGTTKKVVDVSDQTIKCLKLLCAYFGEDFQLLPFLTLVIFSLFLYFSSMHVRQKL